MGIPCAATPLVNYLAVAEHNWALILNHLKQLPQHRVYMHDRRYVENGWGNLTSLKIALACDQTLGLLGFGEIARPMARYAHAFGMKTIYWDVHRFTELEADYHVEYVEWDELWQQSDILSVQIPIKPETHKIVGAREFAMMKPNALFVNTARGKLMDQPALTEALQNRAIGGAALDVFYEEPLPADHPLHDLHDDLSTNVTITPHSAWQGHWTHVRDSLGIWNNVLHVLRGEPIEYRVD
jgi:phosphoglycerate dehydrogenase-like enzyme